MPKGYIIYEKGSNIICFWSFPNFYMFFVYPAIGIVRVTAYLPSEKMAVPALRLALFHFIRDPGNPCPFVFRWRVLQCQ